MKKLSWFNRIVYFFNIVLTLLTVTGYVLPFLAPRMFPILAVLTLGLPFLLMLNLLFFFLLAFAGQKTAIAFGFGVAGGNRVCQ